MHQLETYVHTKDLMIKVKLLHPIYIQITSTNFWEVFSELWDGVHMQQILNKRACGLKAACGHDRKYNMR